MQITEEQIQAIKQEYETFKEGQYSGKTLEERREMDQFFTPPELAIEMIKKLPDLNGKVLDAACGAGNLLVAAILCGANPANIFGIEYDSDILKVAKTRLSRLGVPDINIHWGNALNPNCYDFEDGYTFTPDDKIGVVKFTKRKFTLNRKRH